MRCSLRSLSFASATLWGLIGSGLVSAQEAAPAAKPEVRQIQVRVVTQSDGKVTAVAPEAGAYWVGVQLGEVTDALKAQLAIESGLLIQDIMPDSPAQKADLKKFDIIVAIGEKPIGGPADLIAAVNDTKDKELALTIVRTAKKQTVKVTPAHRPAAAAGQGVLRADHLELRGRLNPADAQHLDAIIRRYEVQPNPNSPPLVVWSTGEPQEVGGRGVLQITPQAKPTWVPALVPGVAEAELSKKLDTVLQRLEKLQADVDGLKK